MYYTHYESPIGKLMLVSNKEKLIGLWVENQKYFAASLKEETLKEAELPILKQTADWLEDYFSGKRPIIEDLPLAPIGSFFRQRIWQILCTIPYGETMTYGQIANTVANETGKKSMSAQAVGGAVGHNPISIIIPCHRVVGSTGSLTGFASGIDKKVALLEHEATDMSKFYLPKRGTAL